MKLRLWKGYHSPELAPLIHDSWSAGVLLILCPPWLRDFSFLSAFPEGCLEFHGTWSAAEREALEAVQRRGTWTGTPALGVFTSGTLSLSPRLVLYTRENVLASMRAIFGLFERIQSVFCYPQAFHCFGLVLGYLAAQINGWKFHTPEGKYRRESHLARLRVRDEGLMTLGTPTHFYDLMTEARDIAPSYSCIIGGAGVTRELWLRVRDQLRVREPSIGYGCTEASPGISHLAPGREPVKDFSIGRPLSPSFVVKESGVEISGPSLCWATVQNKRVTFPKELIIPDAIEVSAAGEWFFRGRLDLLLNRGGSKFSLEAIEHVLLDHAGISAMAFPVRDTRLGQDLGLAIVRGAARAENVIEKARIALGEHFALNLDARRVTFIDQIPLNECAKLDRNSIWTMLTERAL